MNENEPNNVRTEPESVDVPISPAPPAETLSPAEEYPFWGYLDLAIFLCVVLIGFFAVNLSLWLFHPKFGRPVLVIVPAQCLIYGFLFLGLSAILKRHYGQPFWLSLRWVRTRIPLPRIVLYGFGLAIGVMLTGAALRTPDVPTPMKDLLSDRSSILIVAALALTLGPLCEELVFRGFLQPVLVRSLGVVAGILLAAIPFGLLHLPEYAWSWRHGLLITLAGMGFGWMRQASGSTRAATIMHSAYNLMFFVVMFSQKGSIPRAW